MEFLRMFLTHFAGKPVVVGGIAKYRLFAQATGQIQQIFSVAAHQQRWLQKPRPERCRVCMIYNVRLCVFLDRFGCLYRSNVTGIIYNNEMADFDIPGTKPIDGVYPSVVNFPAPYKRPFSSMSPAILTNDSGDVQLIIGASGGKRIVTAVSLVWHSYKWPETVGSRSHNRGRRP